MWSLDCQVAEELKAKGSFWIYQLGSPRPLKSCVNQLCRDSDAHFDSRRLISQGS